MTPLSITLVCAIVIIGMIATVLVLKNKKIKEQKKMLFSELESLKKTLNEFDSKNQSLLSQIEEIKHENGDLVNEKEVLINKNSTANANILKLSSQIDAIQQENNNLVSQIEALINENINLKDNVQKLASQIEGLKQENENLKSANDELVTEINSIRKNLSRFLSKDIMTITKFSTDSDTLRLLHHYYVKSYCQIDAVILTIKKMHENIFNSVESGDEKMILKTLFDEIKSISFSSLEEKFIDFINNTINLFILSLNNNAGYDKDKSSDTISDENFKKEKDSVLSYYRTEIKELSLIIDILNDEKNKKRVKRIIAPNLIQKVGNFFKEVIIELFNRFASVYSGIPNTAGLLLEAAQGIMNIENDTEFIKKYFTLIDDVFEYSTYLFSRDLESKIQVVFYEYRKISIQQTAKLIQYWSELSISGEDITVMYKSWINRQKEIFSNTNILNQQQKELMIKDGLDDETLDKAVEFCFLETKDIKLLD